MMDYYKFVGLWRRDVSVASPFEHQTLELPKQRLNMLDHQQELEGERKQHRVSWWKTLPT